MITKLRQSLKAIAGYEDLTKEGPGIENSALGGANIDVFNFNLEGVTFKCTQIRAPILTVNMIEVSFRFPTLKKQDRNKLLGVVNSYNKTKVAMKAVLEEVEKEYFQISFSVEFMCPDDFIVDEIIHPAVKVLRTSGKLLLASLGGHGIALKDSKKDD